jgi:hypothetical protein
MVYLNEVLYVPLLSRRLFSVAEWNRCGGTINFMMDRCHITILGEDDRVVNTVDVDPIYAEEANLQVNDMNEAKLLVNTVLLAWKFLLRGKLNVSTYITTAFIWIGVKATMLASLYRAPLLSSAETGKCMVILFESWYCRKTSILLLNAGPSFVGRIDCELVDYTISTCLGIEELVPFVTLRTLFWYGPGNFPMGDTTIPRVSQFP